MDDERELAIPGNPEVLVEIVSLKLEWGEVPMAIQARFADGHDAGIAREGNDPLPIPRFRLRTIIGLYPHGGKDARHGSCQPQYRLARIRVDRWAHDRRDPRQPRPLEHGLTVGVEF
jgi:hypothetical protein